jgi:hypothetical protein
LARSQIVEEIGSQIAYGTVGSSIWGATVMDRNTDSGRTGNWMPRDRDPRQASSCPFPELFKPHRNLSDTINSNIIRSEMEGGANLNTLTLGTRLEIRTRHRHYGIEYRGEGIALIWGHPRFCPKPTLVRITGSTWGGSMLWLKFIGRGMHLEFAHPIYGRIITSAISEVRVLNEEDPSEPPADSFCPELN